MQVCDSAGFYSRIGTQSELQHPKRLCQVQIRCHKRCSSSWKSVKTFSCIWKDNKMPSLKCEHKLGRWIYKNKVRKLLLCNWKCHHSANIYSLLSRSIYITGFLSRDTFHNYFKANHYIGNAAWCIIQCMGLAGRDGYTPLMTPTRLV